MSGFFRSFNLKRETGERRIPENCSQPTSACSRDIFSLDNGLIFRSRIRDRHKPHVTRHEKPISTHIYAKALVFNQLNVIALTRAWQMSLNSSEKIAP